MITSEKQAIKKIKNLIKKRKFQVNNRTFVPLHSTEYSMVLKKLESLGILSRHKTLFNLLKENGMTLKDYKKIPHIDHFHPEVTCYEVLKDIP